VRIAVVGSGMAGLAAAHGCSALGHSVTLFESQASHGMAAHTLEIDGGRVDIPLRVMGEGPWDETLALARSVGVDSFATEVRLSCSLIGGETWMRSRYMPVTGWPMVGSWRYLGLNSLRCSIGMARLMLAARMLGRDERDRPLTEFLARHDPDRLFWRGVMLPVLGTICTCKEQQLNDWPAGQLLSLLDSISRQGRLRRLTGGTARLAEALAEGSSLIAGAAVSLAREDQQGVLVAVQGQAPKRFDRVIVATQANQLDFLDETQFGDERDYLARIPYVEGELVVHRDQQAMPCRESDWTALNLLTDPDLDQSMFTVWVNAVEPSLAGKAPVFQSWDPIIELDPDQVISRIPLQRAVVNPSSLEVPETLRRWHQQPGRRVFYCGAWAHEGVPLLETAVRSAKAVVEQIRLAAE